MSLEYKVLGQDAASTIVESPVGYVSVVFNSDVAAHSTDGITWTQTTLPLSARWFSVTYGSDKFVTVGYSDPNFVGAYSTDGITWSASNTLPAVDFFYGVGYGDGQFVAVGGGTQGAYSTDGITWTAMTMPTASAWQDVEHGSGLFVAVSDSPIAYSTDAINWTVATSLSLDLQSAAYGSDRFVAVGYYGNSAYSTDGIAWTQTTIPSGNWAELAYGDGKFVAVGYGASTAPYSTDGITWTSIALPATAGWNGVAYGNGKFVATAYGSTIAAYSTDAITWTQTTLPVSASWEAAAYGGQSSSSPKVQYTIPSTKEAITSSIYIANNSSTSQTYSVAVVPDGETLSSIHYIRKDATIDGNDFHDITTKITLSAGDQVITDGSSGDVSINIFGVEK